MPETSREAALELAETLLTDIELDRISTADVARRASRLARLLNDAEAMQWLRYEVSGYPDDRLSTEAVAAAQRSGRAETQEDGSLAAHTISLGEIDAQLAAYRAQIENAAHYGERNAAIMGITQQSRRRERILGALHSYVADRYHELRFGAAVETAFEVVREEVDAAIGELVPDAPMRLAAAFENASADNPEHWASAAATCRRLLKAAADALRPPGDPVDGRKMGVSCHRCGSRGGSLVRQS